MTNRRSLLKYLLISVPLTVDYALGSHEKFWDVKEPSAWNEKEIEEIATRSPWAKQAMIESRTYVGPDTRMAGIESGGGPRRGTGGDGGMMGGSPAGGNYPAGPQLHVRVRWESALPISAALKIAAPAEAARFYVISLSGLPLRSRSGQADTTASRRAGIEQAFQEVTSLIGKNKEAKKPDRVELVEDDGVSFLRFLFAREPHPITAEDKEITLVSAYSGLTIKARFSLRDMVYRDQLAL